MNYCYLVSESLLKKKPNGTYVTLASGHKDGHVEIFGTQSYLLINYGNARMSFLQQSDAASVPIFQLILDFLVEQFLIISVSEV